MMTTGRVSLLPAERGWRSAAQASRLVGQRDSCLHVSAGLDVADQLTGLGSHVELVEDHGRRLPRP